MYCLLHEAIERGLSGFQELQTHNCLNSCFICHSQNGGSRNVMLLRNQCVLKITTYHSDFSSIMSQKSNEHITLKKAWPLFLALVFACLWHCKLQILYSHSNRLVIDWVSCFSTSIHSPPLWNISQVSGRGGEPLSSARATPLPHPGQVEDKGLGVPPHLQPSWRWVLDLVPARY